ncbi:hypothetical protein D9M68_956170 [compost metagenome]
MDCAASVSLSEFEEQPVKARAAVSATAANIFVRTVMCVSVIREVSGGDAAFERRNANVDQQECEKTDAE